MKGPAQNDTPRPRLALAGLLIITCLLGLRGIGDESSVMLSGDMARYVMNGVFVHDLIADGAVTNYDELTRYAERYYARYPALSLGHHPPIPYLSVVPFYWIFGVSIFAVRIAALMWFLAAVWGLFAVAKRLFNWPVAAWAAAIFITNLMVLRAGQYLMSEMPMTAFVLWSVNALLQFCETRRPWRLVWFIILVVLSIYAKQLAALMLPVYATILLVELGWRSLLTKRAAIVLTAGLVLIVPMAIMTVGLSPSNVALALRNSTRLLAGQRGVAVTSIVATIFASHLTIPVLLVMAASVLLLIVRRRWQVVVGLVWVASIVGGSVVFAGAVEPARYAFGALPAYSILIGALASEANSRKTKALAVALLSVALAWQVWVIRTVHPAGAGGYEAAAEYVLAQNHEPAILYHSYFDTGYFVFFARKHDVNRSSIVLRSDKLLGRPTADYENDRQILYARLRQMGVRWLVVESQPQHIENSRRVLYSELAGPQFVERRRFPVVSNGAPVQSLIVYEYLDAQPADLDAEVRIDLPLGKRGFGIRLRDLANGSR